MSHEHHSPQPVSSDAGGAPRRLLLVEDDNRFAHLVRALIQAESKGRYVVDHCTSLRTAGERLTTGEDVLAIILDLSLPDSSGLDTVLRMQAMAPRKAIIVVTGHAEDDTALQAVESGAQDYLVKGGLLGATLIRSIRYSVARKQLELEQRRLIAELQSVLTHVKTLEGLLPICANCKKIREGETWISIERYMGARTDLEFTHGLCPPCAIELYGEFPSEDGDPT